ncbi:MAG: aminomethyl-transferring glycine dehydrogenase subunit GcvPA [Firmicutes bacterium]|jgi:glycine dehydrogenase subunit 1|nr:aminomethyl-transferring glycine dehydrogenase subunit GcvPA [Bacillota bacterium]
MNYIPHTDNDRERMLEAIGVGRVAELFEDIPKKVRLGRPLDLPPGMSELEVYSLLYGLSKKNLNLNDCVSFLGAGVYDHFIPAVVDHVISRSELYTAYTPYQPEVSQAVLQIIYEYQTAICELTGMDVSNASHYDGSTAAAEAAIIAAMHTGRRKAVVSEAVHPEYRRTINTYAHGYGIEVTEIPCSGGVTDWSRAPEAMSGAATLIVQNPNFFGCLEELQSAERAAHGAGALFTVIVDPISLGVLRPPGDYGADIVVGEGQSLGNAPSFGGPYLGIFAVKSPLVRRLPGRVIGMTRDNRGQRGFVMTLQTREQHIRREKATSNICSNEALCAAAALVYMTTMGKQGMREVGELCTAKSHYLAGRLAEVGYRPAFQAPFFKEFAVRCPVEPESIVTRLAGEGILAGYPLGRAYPQFRDCLLIAVTEKRTRSEMDTFVARLEGLK